MNEQYSDLSTPAANTAFMEKASADAKKWSTWGGNLESRRPGQTPCVSIKDLITASDSG